MNNTPNHDHLFVGRVRRTKVDGELAGITLDLYRPGDTMEIDDGTEFVTVLLATDPWETDPTA